MSLDVFLDLALKVATFGVSIGAMIVAVVRTRRKDVDGRLERANERFTEGSRRMDRIDARVSKVESALEAMPGKDEVHSLRLLMAEMSGDMKAINTNVSNMFKSMERLENSVARHDDHLRKAP